MFHRIQHTIKYDQTIYACSDSMLLILVTFIYVHIYIYIYIYMQTWSTTCLTHTGHIYIFKVSACGSPGSNHPPTHPFAICGIYLKKLVDIPSTWHDFGLAECAERLVDKLFFIISWNHGRVAVWVARARTSTRRNFKYVNGLKSMIWFWVQK